MKRARWRTFEETSFLNAELAQARGEAEEREANNVREKGHGGEREGG